MVAGNAAGEVRLYALTLAGTFEFRAPAGRIVGALLRAETRWWVS